MKSLVLLQCVAVCSILIFNCVEEIEKFLQLLLIKASQEKKRRSTRAEDACSGVVPGNSAVDQPGGSPAALF